MSQDLERDLVVQDYSRVAKNSAVQARSLRFAAALLTEVLEDPHSPPMLNLRREVARRMGIDEPEYKDGKFPGIEDELKKAHQSVETLADREQSISDGASQTAQRITEVT